MFQSQFQKNECGPKVVEHLQLCSQLLHFPPTPNAMLISSLLFITNHFKGCKNYLEEGFHVSTITTAKGLFWAWLYDHIKFMCIFCERLFKMSKDFWPALSSQLTMIWGKPTSHYAGRNDRSEIPQLLSSRTVQAITKTIVDKPSWSNWIVLTINYTWSAVLYSWSKAMYFIGLVEVDEDHRK